MSVSSYEKLLSQIRLMITKEDTQFQNSFDAKDELTVT